MDIYEFHERVGSGVDPATEDLATRVIGAAIEVHRLLGPGMPENSYRNALSHELSLRSIPHQVEAPVTITYKDKVVGEGRIDILADERLVIEIKAVEALGEVHRGQTLGYLRARRLQLGLLINFNVPRLREGIKRVINTG